jgi:hypothetical protein
MEATGTAGNLSGLALNGTAQPAVMVATGWRLPVAFTESEFLWAIAGGSAECASALRDSSGQAVAACEPAAFEDRDDKRSGGEPPVVCRARAFRSGRTTPNLSWLPPVGSANDAEEVAA